LSLERCILAGGKINQDILDHLHIGVLKRLNFPEAFGIRAGTVVRGVEDVVKPILGVLKLLVLAQMDGDEQRRVEEDFPVVNGIGAVICKIEILGWGRAGSRY
jgi:hypothetical protein